MHFSTRTQLILLWLLLGTLAAIMCCVPFAAAHLGGEYVPVGNDSWYHARRILDAAADPSAFYQFDPRIAAPEGSMIVWPWGYDYALAWLLRLATLAGFSGPPMQFLIWVPVAFVFVSVALMISVARRLSLSVWSAGIAGLCVALSPLTQALHAVGILDHHYAEYMFLLATLSLGLKWLANPVDHRSGAFLGLVLGIAPAIHNGLFILQLPVLALLFLWWLQGIQVPRRAVFWFAGVLMAATLAVLIPSLPFRMGLFEFYTLSWFHLYVAAGTAAAAVLLSVLPRTNRNFAMLGLAVVLFLLPMGHQLFVAHGFLTGTIKRLNLISEMRSVRQFAQEPNGLRYVSAIYSMFIWLWPVTLGLCVYRGWVERRSYRLFFWLCAVCGLSLLVMQFRMHYYGSFALVLPWLVMAESLVGKWVKQRKLVMLLTSLAFLLMFALPLRYALPSLPAPGGDDNLPALHPLLMELRKACAREPGVVLADNDAGHYIRYYTECSVISNNFLLTRQQAEKVELADHLFSLSADKMPLAAPYVRYVLLRPAAVQPVAGGFSYVAFSQDESAQLVADLLLTPIAQVSPRYTLLKDATIQSADSKIPPSPYIRLYRVRRPGDAPVQPPPPHTVADNSRH